MEEPKLAGFLWFGDDVEWGSLKRSDDGFQLTLRERSDVVAFVNLHFDVMVENFGEEGDGGFIRRGLRVVDDGVIKVESRSKTVGNSRVLFFKTRLRKILFPGISIVWSLGLKSSACESKHWLHVKSARSLSRCAVRCGMYRCILGRVASPDRGVGL